MCSQRELSQYEYLLSVYTCMAGAPIFTTEKQASTLKGDDQGWISLLLFAITAQKQNRYIIYLQICPTPLSATPTPPACVAGCREAPRFPVSHLAVFQLQ